MQTSLASFYCYSEEELQHCCPVKEIYKRKKLEVLYLSVYWLAPHLYISLDITPLSENAFLMYFFLHPSFCSSSCSSVWISLLSWHGSPLNHNVQNREDENQVLLFIILVEVKGRLLENPLPLPFVTRGCSRWGFFSQAPYRATVPSVPVKLITAAFIHPPPSSSTLCRRQDQPHCALKLNLTISWASIHTGSGDFETVSQSWRGQKAMGLVQRHQFYIWNGNDSNFYSI